MLPKIKNLRLISVSLAGLIFVVVLSYHLAYLNRIYPGIKIAGIDIGNKTKDEAFGILSWEVRQRQVKEIVISGPSKTWNISPESLELSYDVEKSVTLAYQIGRNKNPLKASGEKWQAWTRGMNLPLELGYNQSLLGAKLEEISSSIFIPAINPQIKIFEKRLGGKGTRIVIDPGRNGQEVDKRLLSESLIRNLSYLLPQPITLPIIYTQPALSLEELGKSKIRAEKFLDKSIKLTLEDRSLTLDEKELIELVSPLNGFNQEKIASLAASLSLSFNRPPQNASFRFSEGKVTVFKPARDGIKVLEERFKTELNLLLGKIEKEEAKEQTLAVSFERIPSQVKTEDINNLGISKLLGEGKSFFRGSAASRVHNIILASSKLNGLLIAPGESFSFNLALGEVSQTTGYKEAYIIKEGRTILGDGGGVCQVSTTLFRAALAAGLPIEERHPHAYRVSYYEQNSPVGMDATVFAPSVDLKFKNDTPAYILIQSSLDRQTGTLVFDLYGASDGRVTTISQSRIWDQTPPPPALYQDDPTLPLGTEKQVEKAIWGAKVAFDWKVERGGEVLQEQTFYSNYQPWQAVYLRGIKQ
ncbi:MAG: VanW family protein [Patescibacteria group bacterium]